MRRILLALLLAALTPSVAVHGIAWAGATVRVTREAKKPDPVEVKAGEEVAFINATGGGHAHVSFIRARSGLMQSDEAGATWRAVGLSAELKEPVIAIAPGPGARLAGAMTAATVSVSDDGGRSWRLALDKGRVPAAR